jgi:hypothetical protein
MTAPLSGGISLVDGFPFSMGGDRYFSACDHKGPNPYPTLVPGTTPSGGDTIYPQEFGLKLFTRILPGMSDDGTYIIFGVVVPGGKQAQLIWVTANTGAQVGNGTDLSGRTAKIEAIGR